MVIDWLIDEVYLTFGIRIIFPAPTEIETTPLQGMPYLSSSRMANWEIADQVLRSDYRLIADQSEHP